RWEEEESDSQRLALRAYQLTYAAVGKIQQAVQGRAVEGLAFGRALDFHEVPAAGHDDVHVRAAGRVFFVVQVQHGRAVGQTDRYGGQLIADGVALQQALLLQGAHGQRGCDPGAGDAGAAGAAIGLDDVAVDVQRALPQALQVEYGAQAASDQALDLLGAAALLAARRFAIGARMGRARQHAVFGRHPAPRPALQDWRRRVQDAGVAQHVRGAHADKHGAFGMAGESGQEFNGTALVGAAAGVARGKDGLGQGGTPNGKNAKTLLYARHRPQRHAHVQPFVGLAGEQQDLVAPGRVVDDAFHGLQPVVIAVDQHVVQDQQRGPAGLLQQVRIGQPRDQAYLFTGAEAQAVDVVGHGLAV